MLRILGCRRSGKRERVVLGVGGEENCATLCSEGSANRCAYSLHPAGSRHNRYFAAQIRELHTATYSLRIPEKQNHPGSMREESTGFLFQWPLTFCASSGCPFASPR